ncbi:MAG TPA: TlpA disulfide reductase family protein [Bacteroidia bacterium]|jgi:thiol-disulfide isomerase/thioredoxin
MKKILYAAITVCAFSFTAVAQTGSTLPAADVKTLDGKTFNTSKLSNDGKPMIISFWATWCKPCKKELDAVAEYYAEWQKETGVKLIAVSTDDSRSSAKVVTDVKSKGWDYEVYIDENQDFKRAMNVGDIPHVFIVNGKGEIVWQHNGYAEGDEEHMYEIVKKVAKGEKIE